MRFRISLALAMLSVTALASSGPSTAQAEMLRFTFNDIAGDPRDNFDVTQVEVTFDNVTGAYTIAAESTQEHPFSGSHYLYLGAFNPDTPSENQYFGVGRFGYYTETVSTRQERSGVSPNLVGWMAGERVASYDLFGSPSGNAFQSVIGGNRGVYNETDEIRDDAVIQSVVVPEPQALLGVLWGGLLLLGSRRSQ